MRLIGLLLALALSLLAADACRAGAAEEHHNALFAEAESSRWAKATFAGGCFWCMEPPFDQLDGVIGTISGYTGGTVEHPSYEQVSAGGTGHTEAVRVLYDPAKISYKELLDVYWREVDPFDNAGQFCDRGTQYRPGIFVHDDEQRRQAEASKAALQQKFGRAVEVTVTDASVFYPAENYHQDYYEKNPIRYKFYRNGCGRDARLREIWGE